MRAPCFCLNFQVEIFTPAGKDPLACAAVRGSVRRSYERSIKGYAYSLEGGPNSTAATGAKLQLPRDASKGLGLVQQYLVLQLELPADSGAVGGSPLGFELAMTDAKKVPTIAREKEREVL